MFTNPVVNLEAKLGADLRGMSLAAVAEARLNKWRRRTFS